VAQNYDTSGQPLPGTSSGTLTITITAPLVPTLLPIIDQSLIDNADTKTTLATEFFGAPHSLQVNAHSPTDPAGGPPSKIIYANWRTNSGTLAITGNQNTATWSPGACAATGATATVTLYDTVTGLSRDFSWQIGTCAPRSCGAIKRQHPEWTTNTNDGVWAIDPDGTGPGAPMLVSCDMWRHGGGWQLVAAMGSQHLVLRTDTLDSATPMARPPNSLTPFCTRGNCPQFNPAAAYEHHDLRTFAAFGAAHTWRVEAAAPVNGTTSQQFTFFRATCTGASCTPAIAVGNWFGTLINSNYLLLNSGSALLAPNTHWIPTPPWVNSSGGTQFFAMFGYRNEAPPSGCTTGSCPCTTGGQTAVCLGSPGGIASGTYGVPSADTDLEDAVSYQPAGQLMNLWLRDDANPVVGTP
jgi:hypothetical protein